MENTSKFSNPIFSVDNATFVNASNFAVGGFFVPDYNSFSNYWKRVTYRAGFNFGNTGLKINNEDKKYESSKYLIHDSVYLCLPTFSI